MGCRDGLAQPSEGILPRHRWALSVLNFVQHRWQSIGKDRKRLALGFLGPYRDRSGNTWAETTTIPIVFTVPEVPIRRSADYVDRILHGAKPGDIPVEQLTKFDLVVNLTTPKALGLTIPPRLLARADEVKLGLPASSWLHDDLPVHPGDDRDFAKKLHSFPN
jgi:ABC transporter substrate binding protein